MAQKMTAEGHASFAETAAGDAQNEYSAAANIMDEL